MPEVEYPVVAGAKLPYVVHLFCPSPRNETLRAFLPKAFNKRPDSRRLGLLSRVIHAPHVLLIGNCAVAPLMEDYWVHCTNITLTVMYVNPPVRLTTATQMEKNSVSEWLPYGIFAFPLPLNLFVERDWAT